MIINGLEKLTKEEIDKIDLDYLEYLIFTISDLYPIKTLGSKVNVSNIKDLEDFSFDLDNGNELIEIKVHNNVTTLSIVIFYRDFSFHYMYDVTKKKVIVHEMYMNIKNLLLRHKMYRNEYMFELYNYDDCSDTTIYFKDDDIDLDLFIKELFSKGSNIDSYIGLLPKKYLKVKIESPVEQRYIEYRNNKLINDIKGDNYGKEREKRKNKF